MNKEKLRKAGVWLLAIFLFASHIFIRTVAHADETSAWKQIVARTGDCRISFPSVPQMVQQSFKISKTGQTLNYDIYVAPLNDKNLCLLLVASYPVAVPKEHQLTGLEGLLNGILGQNAQNKLLYANVVDHNGHQAVDFLIQSPTSFFRGHALISGNKLYLIALEGHREGFDEPSFNLFLQSFSLVP